MCQYVNSNFCHCIVNSREVTVYAQEKKTKNRKRGKRET